MKFANSMFQASLFKMSFTKIILIYFFVISILSTQTLIWSQIELGFHCFYLEIIWKIHGILCHKRRGNPASVLTHVKIFVIKICMKVPGIWHKKTWKNLEFRTKNDEKTWNLVFGKKQEPCWYKHRPISRMDFVLAPLILVQSNYHFYKKQGIQVQSTHFISTKYTNEKFTFQMLHSILTVII